MEASDPAEPKEAASGRCRLMREELKACHEATRRLWELSKTLAGQWDDEQYAMVEEYLAERERLLPGIVPPFTEEEQKAGAAIAEYNKEIDRNLAAIKRHIAVNIKNLKKKEQSSRKYLGYSNAGEGGYFYDKKN
ncbi:MAG: hypothetical protein ACI35R_04120 [Bacillus sp. (in: firmicutes)]